MVRMTTHERMDKMAKKKEETKKDEAQKFGARKVDRGRLAEMVESQASVEQVAAEFGINTGYAKGIIRDTIAEKHANGYPGLFTTKRGVVIPKVKKNGSLVISSKFFESLDFKVEPGDTFKFKVDGEQIVMIHVPIAE